jgi:hypothetical protein
MTVAQLQAQLDQLNKAIASGVLTTSFQGRSTTYRSQADLERAAAALQRQIDQTAGTKPIRRIRIEMTEH